ncbi:MAG: DUF2934 domain-containing protein [Pseudomonadota bacterium]|nr:DUF2934 domain-containing protein [Pseudomonadota bacterium]
MNNAAQTAGFEELVRFRAYALWESEGRPFGRDAEHWRASEEATRAELTIAAQPAKTTKPAPRKKAKRAPAAASH